MRIFSLRDKITLFFIVVILALVVSSFYQVNTEVEKSLDQIMRAQLGENNEVFRQLQAFTLTQIQGKSDIAGNQIKLRAIMSRLRADQVEKEERARNVEHVIATVKKTLGVDFFLVWDWQGYLLFPNNDELRQDPTLANPRAVRATLASRTGQQQVINWRGTLYLTAVSPVLEPDADDEGLKQILGVVAVAQELAPLTSRIEKIAGGETSVAFCSGMTVLNSTLEGPGKQALLKALKAQRLKFEAIEQGNKPQDLILFDIAGERQLALVIPIHESLGQGAAADQTVVGTLTFIRSLDKILNKQMAPIQLRLIAIGLVALFLTILINFAFARTITRPLSRLTEGLGQVAQGNLRLEVPVTTRDEIGLLTQSFNEMVVGLSHKEKLSRMVSDEAARQVESSSGSGMVLGGVHQRRTVLFSDIRNFTPMTEQLGAEEIVELLNSYFAVAGQVIADHGGDIDKFIGDAIMVVFCDDEQCSGALKAVRCAIELQRQVRSFNAQHAARTWPDISIGVGIATGEVVAGTVGTPMRLEYTVLGDTVNVAARLESESKGGQHLQIMLDPTTNREITDHVEVELISGITLKGKNEPMTIYEVKGLKS